MPFILLLIIASIFLIVFICKKQSNEPQIKLPLYSEQASTPNTRPYHIKYFDNLFSRLSHFREWGARKHIDIIIFALFKTRLCASLYVNTNIQGSTKQQEVMDEFDFALFLSFGLWMDKNYPQFTNKAEIIDSRLQTYEQVLMTSDASDIEMLMFNLSRAFYWILENGWRTNDLGDQIFYDAQNNGWTIIYDLSWKEGEKKYMPIMDEFDIIVLGYFEREHSKLMHYIVDYISNKEKREI